MQGLGWLQVAGAVLGVGARVAGGVWLSSCRVTGIAANGARLERMKASPQWHEAGKGFTNVRPRIDGSAWQMVAGWFFGGSDHA